MAINSSTTIIGKLPSVSLKKGVAAKTQKTYGFQFPIGSELNKGLFGKVTGRNLLLNNLNQLLGTERGERVMMPDFGISLRRFLFEPLDDITKDEIRNDIQNSLSRYEPRVEIIRLQVGEDLEEIGLEGLSTLIINLTLRTKEDVDSVFDIQVRVK